MLADKVWIAPIPLTGNLNITKVEFTNGTPLSSVDSIYQVGTIGQNRTIRIRICATYSCTENLDPESFVLFTGWECAAFPSTLDSLECLPDDNITLTVQPKQAGLQATFTGTDSIDLCGPIPFEIFLNSTGVGTIGDLFVRFTLPAGTGIFFESGSGVLQFPFPSASPSAIPDPTPIGGNTFEWELAALNDFIAKNGLRGGGFDPTNSKLKITFNLSTNCDFRAGEAVSFEASGVSNCSDPVVLAFQSEPFTIIGFPEFTTSDLELNSNDFGTCDTLTTVNVQITNTGNLPIGDNDSVHVLLPQGIDFISGSFNDIQNAPVNAVPVQTPVGISTELVWHLPAGVVPGSIIFFSFDIARTSLFTCGPLTLEGSVVVTDTVDCATGGECQVGTSASKDITVLNVQPPVAEFALSDSICLLRDTLLLISQETCGSNLWNFGDGITSTVTNPVHIYDNTPEGFYEVTHIINTGCAADTVRRSLIVTCCKGPNAAFTLPDSVCLGDSLILSSIDITNSHFWDFGEGNTSTAINPVHTYDNTPEGFYEVWTCNEKVDSKLSNSSSQFFG